MSAGSAASAEAEAEPPEYTDAKTLPTIATPRVPPEFTGGVVDGRADAGLVGAQRAHDRLGGRRRGQPKAAAEQHHLHRDLRCTGVLASTVDAQASPAAKMARPAATTAVRADLVHHSRPEHTGDRDRDGDRQQPHARLECAVGLDELEVLGDDEDEAEQREEARGHRQAAAGEPAIARTPTCRASAVGCAAPTARTR